MEKKLKKEKHRLYARIMLSMFLLSLIMFATISVSILSNEKQKLEAAAYTEFNMVSDNAVYLGENGASNIDFVNYGQDLENRAHIKISDVSKTNDTSKKILAETANAVSVSYYDEKKASWFGTVDFDKFRNTLTDEQYETICNYLLEEKNEKGEYYLLVCTEFYYRENEILPRVIEVLYTKPGNDWYVQDTVVQQYTLNPVTQFGDVLYKAPGDMRNVLFEDFVLGKYEVERYLDEVDEFYKNFNADEYYYTHTEGPFPLRTGLFTYLVYYNDYTSGVQQVYVEAEEPSDDDSIGYEVIDGVYMKSDTEEYAYDIRYAKEFNILEGCIDSIIIMFIYILVLFTIVGIIIGAISWKALKKQIDQEQKLRTVTNAMAHELKTPLFIIGGYCDNLMENINKDKHEHYAYVISQQAQDMNELVVRMLEYSKLDSSSFNPKVEIFSITALINDLLSNYEQYNIEFESDKEINIMADKKLITSMLENLIENAIKYTTDVDGIKVAVKNGKLTVSNPCDRISEYDIENMWQPYHRHANNSKKDGFGLGLAIVKSVCETHNMKYRAYYSDGQITFEVILPKYSQS